MGYVNELAPPRPNYYFCQNQEGKIIAGFRLRYNKSRKTEAIKEIALRLRARGHKAIFQGNSFRYTIDENVWFWFNISLYGEVLFDNAITVQTGKKAGGYLTARRAIYNITRITGINLYNY